MVAAREVSYFILCLVGCFVAPQYLLTNVAAEWSRDAPLGQRLLNIAAFGVSPEKFLLIVLFKGDGPGLIGSLLLLLPADLCAVMAFTVGLIRSMPAPLAARCVAIPPQVCL